MKVRDIVEYGMLDEPAQGTSKAAVRRNTSDVANQNKRMMNRQTDAATNATIAQQQASRQERRRRKAPTGIPARLMQPGGQQ